MVNLYKSIILLADQTRGTLSYKTHEHTFISWVGLQNPIFFFICFKWMHQFCWTQSELWTWAFCCRSAFCWYTANFFLFRHCEEAIQIPKAECKWMQWIWRQNVPVSFQAAPLIQGLSRGIYKPPWIVPASGIKWRVGTYHQSSLTLANPVIRSRTVWEVSYYLSTFWPQGK